MADRNRRLAQWRARYPTITELETLAQRRVPYFAFDFLQGGTGEELSCARNLAALRDIEIMPRYSVDVSAPDISSTLFGRSYSSPLVIAPVGMDGAIWPGATGYLAETARDLKLAYMPSTMATRSIEDIAGIAPESAWFQLYGFPKDDHKVSFDLIRRAEAAGAHVLGVTVDIPGPARRVRDMRNGLGVRFRPTPKAIAGILTRPAWFAGLLRSGFPVVENVRPYCREGARKDEIEAFVRDARAGSGVHWDVIARIRDKWPRKLVIKGVLHPADAERAASLGLDGVIVSNHGGRQFDPAPAPIDVLPAIRAAVGDRMEILMDSGIRSGTDIFKAIACGADGVLAGRAFIIGLAALGADGARHVAAVMMEELRVALVQSGAVNLAGVRKLAIRHRNAWRLEDFAESMGSSGIKESSQ